MFRASERLLLELERDHETTWRAGSLAGCTQDVFAGSESALS